MELLLCRGEHQDCWSWNCQVRYFFFNYCEAFAHPDDNFFFRLFAKIRDVYGNDVDINGWSSIHFVGHSLGSHISAHAAHLIKESQKGQSQRWIVRRITGLDPAQPCFGDAEESLKLDKTDAAFVDVIHTNARNLLLLGLGLPDQLGN